MSSLQSISVFLLSLPQSDQRTLWKQEDPQMNWYIEYRIISLAMLTQVPVSSWTLVELSSKHSGTSGKLCMLSCDTTQNPCLSVHLAEDQIHRPDDCNGVGQEVVTHHEV